MDFRGVKKEPTKTQVGGMTYSASGRRHAIVLAYCEMSETTPVAVMAPVK